MTITNHTIFKNNGMTQDVNFFGYLGKGAEHRFSIDDCQMPIEDKEELIADFRFAIFNFWISDLSRRPVTA